MAFLMLLLTGCYYCCVCPQTTLDAYPCGSDHTPSPMASSVAVEAEPILDSPSARLTAVAISVKTDHTIAFLGDSKGNLRKVTFFFFFLFLLYKKNYPLSCVQLNDPLSCSE